MAAGFERVDVQFRSLVAQRRTPRVRGCGRDVRRVGRNHTAFNGNVERLNDWRFTYLYYIVVGEKER